MITMTRFGAGALLGTVGLAWFLAPGVGAQVPAEPMAGMHERMQSMESMMQHMHQMMMSMHGGAADQAGEPGMGMGMGMQGQATAAGSCSMGADLATLLGACPSNLALTEAQATELRTLLERARGEARGILTPEQHTQLHATPSAASGAAPSGAAPH